MAIREILEVPDPRLKQVSVPVEKFDDELRTLVADMFETMYDAPGIGLAAIQVGVPLRVLVIDLQPDDPDAEPKSACARMATTIITSRTSANRGCSSIPNSRSVGRAFGLFRRLPFGPEIYADVERPAASAPAGRTWTARSTKRTWTACWPPACSTKWTTSKASCSSTTSVAPQAQMALKKLEKLRKAA
jgi:peptide deformylase